MKIVWSSISRKCWTVAICVQAASQQSALQGMNEAWLAKRGHARPGKCLCTCQLQMILITSAVTNPSLIGRVQVS